MAGEEAGGTGTHSERQAAIIAALMDPTPHDETATRDGRRRCSPAGMLPGLLLLLVALTTTAGPSVAQSDDETGEPTTVARILAGGDGEHLWFVESETRRDEEGQVERRSHRLLHQHPGLEASRVVIVTMLNEHPAALAAGDGRAWLVFPSRRPGASSAAAGDETGENAETGAADTSAAEPPTPRPPIRTVIRVGARFDEQLDEWRYIPSRPGRILPSLTGHGRLAGVSAADGRLHVLLRPDEDASRDLDASLVTENETVTKQSSVEAAGGETPRMPSRPGSRRGDPSCSGSAARPGSRWTCPPD